MKYQLVLIIILLNPWTLKILQGNLLLAVILIISSVALLKSLTIPSKKNILTTFILFISAGFLILSSGIDKSLWKATPEDSYLLNQRRSYYPDNLGRVFQNKAALSIHKIQSSLFYNLDPNLYFFSNHPRERAGVDEFVKYPPIYLALFVLGLIWLIKQKSKPALAYFALALIISAFARSTLILGPVLIYPFINSTIALGTVQLWELIKKS